MDGVNYYSDKVRRSMKQMLDAEEREYQKRLGELLWFVVNARLSLER